MKNQFRSLHVIGPNTRYNLCQAILEVGYLNLTEKERYRLDGEIALTWEIITDLAINLRFYHNLDTKSPATGKRRTGIGVVTGITYTF